ncbi:ABC transporter, ATP-binding protein [Phycicoccus elongatus Lp2]|uniref:ABC transporter, ATP-binding protein n=1 Tax=Phycicoccus elongatus Lp2 TaxID=1193181 RepID=N0E532_9MICO|nr:ABC transporter, ATP-binding protein [Phycicoccus elongatus Lp2]
MRASVDAAVREQGLTLVVVEHVLGPWIDLVDRLIVLDASGVIVADGPVRETLATRHTELVGMGVWVPGAGAPDPLPVDPALVGAPHLGPAHPRQSSEENTRSAVRPRRMFSSLDCLEATPLTVTRRTATVDGIVTERVAARLEEPLRLAPGELAALVGRSGSGKSTILHALAGFLVPAKGTLRVGDDEDPARLEPVELARRLAWIPQWASSTIVTGRVLDEVLLTSRQLGDDTPGLEDRARGLLETLGLGRLADADPRHLSGGEMRRLAIASAILHGPDIVLADAPPPPATHDQAVIDRAHQVHHLDGQPREAPGPHGRPWLSGRNPLALLAGAALAVPAGVASPGWRASIVLLALQFVLAVAGLTSRRAGLFRPLRALAVRLLPGVLAALSVAWSTWLLGGRSLDLAATGFTRVLLIVLPSAVLLPFIDTDRLGDELAQRLRLPDRFVVAVAAALHRMQSFGDIWTEIARARKVRGIGISWRRTKSVVRHVIALTIGLLVRSLRSAAELAVAMDARGFATAHRRSWLRPVTWRVRDSVVVVASMMPLLLTLLFRR